MEVGRCRWAGMSDAFGVKRDDGSLRYARTFRPRSTNAPGCEESWDSLPEVCAGLRAPATICHPSGVRVLLSFCRTTLGLPGRSDRGPTGRWPMRIYTQAVGPGLRDGAPLALGTEISLCGQDNTRQRF